MDLVFIGRPGLWCRRAIEQGSHLLAYGRDDGETKALRDLGLELLEDLEQVWERLAPPRAYLFETEPGPAIDHLLDTHYEFMEPGDCVIDPSPSYWGDTLRRYRRMRHRAIYYVDVALERAGDDAVLLAGGEERALDQFRPWIERIAGPAELQLTGHASSAHFMAGLIEGLASVRRQAMSEVQQLIEAFPQSADAGELGKLAARMGLQPAGRGDTGRSHWLMDDAMNLEAVIPLMSQALIQDMAERLDEHRATRLLPRIGPFVHPDDIL